MTQHYVGTKIVTAWEQMGIAKTRVCGVDCHPGSEHCNGYCNGEAEQPTQKEPEPGYAVKYENGHISWSPKAIFEAAYTPMGHVGHLQPHVQRVVAEKAQLDGRLRLLRSFLKSARFLELGEHAQDLLCKQLHLMEELTQVLADRIESM